MDVSTHIAKTLTLWMSQNPGLDTLKKVSARSGVGFGTVQRAKNGDGNTTVKNLALIAKAFGRPVEDLIGIVDGEIPASYLAAADSTKMTTQEPQAAPYLTERLKELIELTKTMSDEGQAILLGRAQEIALRYPQEKSTFTLTIDPGSIERQVANRLEKQRKRQELLDDLAHKVSTNSTE